MTPTPPGVVITRVVPRPADVVWSALTDLRRHEAWIPLTRIEAPEHAVVGDVMVAVSGPTATRGGPGLVDRMVVELSEPPEEPASGPARTGRARYRKVGPVLLGTAEIHVRPLGPGHCVLLWSEDVHLRMTGRKRTPAWWRAATGAVVTPFLGLMLRLAVHRAVRDLTC